MSTPNIPERIWIDRSGLKTAEARRVGSYYLEPEPARPELSVEYIDVKAVAEVWEKTIAVLYSEIQRQSETGLWPSDEDFRAALEAARKENQ